ncbi:MAG TPA: zinc ribbon domain-containing protein [Gemmatimonadaceae bacterium]
MDSANAIILLVLAGGVILVLLWPRRRRGETVTAATTALPDADPDDPAVLALREIEQDRAMGRLSEADYETLRARYEAARRESLGAAATVEAPAAPAEPEPLEARAESLVRRWRAATVTCPTCGVRPEPEAAFCSNCGRVLRPCPRCGRSIEQPGARFCPACGASLTG